MRSYVLLRVDAAQWLVDGPSVLAMGPAGGLVGDAGRAGRWRDRAGRRVVAFDAALRAQEAGAPRARYAMLAAGDTAFGVFCDEALLIGESRLRMQPLPRVARAPGSPVLAAAILQMAGAEPIAFYLSLAALARLHPELAAA